MKSIIVLLFLFPTVAIAQPLDSIKESLQPWKPLSVAVKNKKLTVVTAEQRVTSTIFTAIIKNGICMPIWLGNPDALNGITEVNVLNKFKHQGYVFEGGKELCDEMGKLNSKKSEIYLLGHSHIHTDRKP